jgi:hypothetical protein
VEVDPSAVWNLGYSTEFLPTYSRIRTGAWQECVQAHDGLAPARRIGNASRTQAALNHFPAGDSSAIRFEAFAHVSEHTRTTANEFNYLGIGVENSVILATGYCMRDPPLGFLNSPSLA